jgi:hypothetical protein
MKELTYEEFNDRMMAINRAKRIFSDSGLTKNITVAFELYQEVFAEREREIFIKSSQLSEFTGSPIDKFERPLCPDCNTVMGFRIVPPNSDGIKTQLICMNGNCDIVLNSENGLEWWINNLKRRK